MIKMVNENGTLSLPVDGREGLVLFFIVGNHTLGMRLTDVVHIEPFREMAGEGQPRGDAILLGNGPGGETVPAVDLRRFLGVEVANTERERTLILLKKGEGRFGLIADGVQSIVPAHEVPEMAYPRLLGQEGKRIYDGFFNRGDRLVLALNPQNVWDGVEYEEGEAVQGPAEDKP